MKKLTYTIKLIILHIGISVVVFYNFSYRYTLVKINKIIDLIVLRTFQVVFWWLVLCGLVILMDMSSNIGVTNVASGVTNRVGSGNAFAPKPLQKYKPPLIDWVEMEKVRIKSFQPKPLKENKE